MLKPNTLLVLGAAMSAELKLPLGEGLKESIADVLPHQNGGDDFVRYALCSGPDMQVRMHACAMIRQALPKAASIDNLIEHRGHDPAFKHCAKVGILSAILLAERKSTVYRKPGNALGNISADDSSYAALFRLIVGNASTQELPEAIRRVRVVNFNYDRCLEQYFHDWLIGYSNLDANEAWRIVDQLEVARPYGSIGPLPRQQDPDARAVPFGAYLDGLPLNDLASNILTFSEERQSETDQRVQDLTGGAEQIIFLGCAYHPQNLRLLRPQDSRAFRVFGTCYMPPPEDPYSAPSLESFSEPTRNAFQNALENWPCADLIRAKRFVRFEPLTCRQLVAKYSADWIASNA